MSSPKRIIIDTDPGIDDAMAILWAFLSPDRVDVVGLTTVYGNAPVEQTTENALRLVELYPRRKSSTDNEMTPVVVRGAEGPLLRPFEYFAWRVHGRNGLGDVVFSDPPPSLSPQADKRRAAQFIVDTVMASQPGEITLLTLGPLTNLAIAVALEPRIAERVQEVVVMGGAAHGRGNASATAEANFRNDPEAAKIVLNAPWKVIMVGLDVTTQTIMTPEYLRALTTTAPNTYTDFIQQIVPHYLQFYQNHRKLDGFYVHDSSALAYVMDPTLFTTRHVHVHVETQSSFTRGQTVVDWRPTPDDTPPNAHVCVEVDSVRLLQMYQERLLQGTAK